AAPPAAFFLYFFVPDNFPSAQSGFRTASRNPFQVQFVFAYDNWEYKYCGQWWSMGSLAVNVLFFVVPLFLWLILQTQSDQSSNRDDNSLTFYFSNAGFFFFQIYTNTG
uniref:NDUB4 n=1 Tax=Tetrahymena thermophila TaxID=5911 RepID=UPI001FBC14F6|nr:Chain B4, NDUB4 [Tetrahymena thermophila]